MVEYGGSWLLKEGTPPRLRIHEDLCPPLVRISPEGPAVSRDAVGTSFATPKVTNIVASLEALYPEGSTLLYRALVAQSAKWPSWAKSRDPQDALRLVGYGIPNIVTATFDSDYRVTLFRDFQSIWPKQAHVFEVPIPDKINTPGEDYDILIEVTLSYKAKPRRTRKLKRKYLSTWVNWTSSKLGESKNSFVNRILKNGSQTQVVRAASIPWEIGQTSGAGRDAGTLLKDWAVIKSHQLPESFCISVIGHEGWDQTMRFPAEYSLTVTFEILNREVEIYNEVRTRVETLIENEVEIQIESK